MREYVSISFAQFSRCFWERVEQVSGEQARDIEFRIGGGPYATSLKDAYWLFCLARFYEPKTVCEIGTYRGRSTHALANGMREGTIWTCDKDVDWNIGEHLKVSFKRHHTTSTQMLEGMSTPIDLFFFDGRIQPDDVPHIKRLSHEKTVYVLDDFEGLEKGVHNALKLNDPTKILITQNGKLAVLIPWKTIQVTHQ